MITLPLVAEAGRTAMHVALVLIVLLAIAVPLLLRRRRRHDEPVDRLDGSPTELEPEGEQ